MKSEHGSSAAHKGKEGLQRLHKEPQRSLGTVTKVGMKIVLVLGTKFA